MPKVYIESLSEFTAKWGPSIRWPDPRRPYDHRWLHEKGGSRRASDSTNGQWVFTDAPSDPEARLLLQLEYHELKRVEAGQAFAELKLVELGMRDGHLPGKFRWDEVAFGPPPSDRHPLTGLPCGLAALKRLKEIHDKHLARVIEIEQQIAELPSVKLRRAQEELRRKQLEKSEAAQRDADTAMMPAKRPNAKRPKRPTAARDDFLDPPESMTEMLGWD